jgi:3-phenylpropionate/trans-cinnamate dioxygenase ferredoxin reductase subunit
MHGALSLRTLDDSASIFKDVRSGTHVSIVGGGLIGLEVAATSRRLGATVTVIELGQTLMARAVAPSVAEVDERRHRDEGVRFIFGARVVESSERHVELASGRRVEADLVLAAVGSVPNSDLALSAGLKVDNGIRVDGDFRTSDRSIYAAGDCCNVPLGGNVGFVWKIGARRAIRASEQLGE